MDFLFAFFDIFTRFESASDRRGRASGSDTGYGPVGMGYGPIGMGYGPIG
jgi:hypothetical protein